MLKFGSSSQSVDAVERLEDELDGDAADRSDCDLICGNSAEAEAASDAGGEDEPAPPCTEDFSPGSRRLANPRACRKVVGGVRRCATWGNDRSRVRGLTGSVDMGRKPAPQGERESIAREAIMDSNCFGVSKSKGGQARKYRILLCRQVVFGCARLRWGGIVVVVVVNGSESRGVLRCVGSHGLLIGWHACNCEGSEDRPRGVVSSTFHRACWRVDGEINWVWSRWEEKSTTALRQSSEPCRYIHYVHTCPAIDKIWLGNLDASQLANGRPDSSELGRCQFGVSS